MMIIAFFIVVCWGFFNCFSHAKQAWIAGRNALPGTTKKLHILSVLLQLVLGFMALGGLFQAIVGAGTNG